MFSITCSVPRVQYHMFSTTVFTFQLYASLPQVERRKNLLTSLADEKERWEAGSETFKSQMSTITGDVLLTFAFMVYGGMRCVWDCYHLEREERGGGG